MMSRAKKRLVGAVLPSPGEYSGATRNYAFSGTCGRLQWQEEAGDAAFGSTLPAAAVAQF